MTLTVLDDLRDLLRVFCAVILRTLYSIPIDVLSTNLKVDIFKTNTVYKRPCLPFLLEPKL